MIKSRFTLDSQCRYTLCGLLEPSWLRLGFRPRTTEAELVPELVRTAPIVLGRASNLDVPDRAMDRDPRHITCILKALRKHELDVAAQVLADGESCARVCVGGEQIEVGGGAAKPLAYLHSVQADRTAREAQELAGEKHQQLAARDLGLGQSCFVGELPRQKQRYDVGLTQSRASEVCLDGFRRAADFESDVVALNAGLQRKVDVRFGSRGAREVDRSSHDLVRAAAKEDVPALLKRQPPGQHRLADRSDDAEVAGQVEPAVVVVDDDVLSRLDVDVERDAIGERGLGARCGRDGAGLDAGQQLRSQTDRLPIRSAKDRNGAVEGRGIA